MVKRKKMKRQVTYKQKMVRTSLNPTGELNAGPPEALPDPAPLVSLIELLILKSGDDSYLVKSGMRIE